MYDIIVMGSINMDVIVESYGLPKRGNNDLCKSIKTAAGGKGNNQAVSAARYGKKVCFIGCVGNDDSGRQLRENLRRRGVDDTYMLVKEGQNTGSCVAIIEPSGDNTMMGCDGANTSFGADDVSHILEQIDGKILLIQQETSKESVLAAMRIARAKGMYVILDPAPVTMINPEAFPYADLIVPNSNETRHITGIEVSDEKSALEAARKIHSMGVRNVIVKMGGNGCLLSQDEKTVFIPSLPVKAVDTVGAGDCFAGALANHLIDDMTDLESAVRFAQVVAGIKVSRFGGHDAIPALDEVKSVLSDLTV
ncbi:ribokinase [Klebsiella michiganensis]|uniref:Ribokinase n=1 Tax=Enterobacter huaxiensis TaxID=2494702 RepID=A0A3R9PRR7_9ENTR|nr:ribokinase [Enterobacter huaxiensis]RSK63101.1 ribokinase [Enterobacter huaxiensis]